MVKEFLKVIFVGNLNKIETALSFSSVIQVDASHLQPSCFEHMCRKLVLTCALLEDFP